MQITKYGYRLSYWGFVYHKVKVPALLDSKGNTLVEAYTIWESKHPRNRSYHSCNRCRSFVWRFSKLNFSVSFSFCLTKVPSALVQNFNKMLVGMINDTADPWTRVK